MKKASQLLCILLISIVSLGQADSADMHLFGNLNGTEIPTGYLGPYGIDILDKEDFNGLITDSNVINSMDIVRMSYADVYTARYYSAAPTLPLPDTFSKNIDNAHTNALALFFAKYSIFDENAINNNQLQYNNGQLFDVSTRLTHPYLVKNLFTAYPKQKYYLDTVLFYFDPSLFISNTSLNLQSLQIDFGTGYQTINTNTSIKHGYIDSSGIRVISIKIQLSDNSIFYTKVVVWVDVTPNQNNNGSRYAPVPTVLGRLATPEINVSAVQGVHDGYNAYIIRSVNTPSGQIKKPLIVVEGYDLNDGAPSLASNYEVNDLIKSWQEVFISGNSFDYYLDDIAGYDLIFVDWKNSMDDITRNAVALEDLIGRINTIKAQSGYQSVQNVVMGISMGGLISRYCLASMTKRSINPQTRLLITHDSPHQGAYVPLALQHLAKDLQNKLYGGIRIGRLIGALDEAANLLDKTATRQQLKMYVTDDNGFVSQNTFLNTTYRDMVEFPNPGVQPSYNFIATSQGSQCGIAPLPVGATLVAGAGQYNSSGLAFLLTAGILSRSKLYGEIEAYGLTGSSNHQILHCLLKRKTRLFWGLVNADKTIVNINRNEPSFNTIPWESVPGGVESLADRLQSGSTLSGDWGGWFLGINYNITLASRFGFVPLISALDMVTPPTTYQGILNVRALPNTPGGTFRVDDYVAQESFFENGTNQYNKPHTTFTSRNSLWLYNEMEGNSNSNSCSQYNDYCLVPIMQMSYTQTDCFNATITAGVTNGTSYSWQVYGDLLINGTSTTATTTTNSVNITGTSGSLYVITSQTCGNSEGWLEYEPFQRVLEGLFPEYTSGDHVSVSVNTTVYDTYYRWYINDVLVGEGEYASSYCTCYNGLDPRECGENTIKVEVETSCGVTQSFEGGFWKMCSYYLMESNVEMYPNPATAQTSINLKNNNDEVKTKLKDIKKINVYDKYGSLKKSSKHMNGTKSVVISLTGLPIDIYIVEVSDGINKTRLKLYR